MVNTAYFNFSGNLNDFLATRQKHSTITYSFNDNPSIKDAIEAIGIPHTEVNKILANGVNVDFLYRLNNGDLVEVFPINQNPEINNYPALIPPNSVPTKFIADVHLGRLVKLLRMLGIDILYQNNYTDHIIVELAVTEGRIVLTRDVGLLKHKALQWGYWLRSQKTEAQLDEVIHRFHLIPQVKPFTRCLECNGLIERVQKQEVLEKLPANTAIFFQEFYQCSCCKKVYWKGSHFERMETLVKKFTT